MKLRLDRIPNRIFDALCSLKLAIIVIIGLAASLAVGTILESIYDTDTAQYWVYRSLWFHLILAALAVNIFCVAISRYPWKRKHIPFLLAHAGILILLAGAWITEQYGLDGNIRVGEGDTANSVQLNTAALTIVEGNNITKLPIKWVPPNATFSPIDIPNYGIRIDKFMSHADSDYSFVPPQANEMNAPAYPAVKLKIQGGPMPMAQEFWMWAGDANFSRIQAGPALLEFLPEGHPVQPAPQGMPALSLTLLKSGALRFVGQNAKGQQKTGQVAFAKAKGYAIDPGWRQGVTATIEDFVPRAVMRTNYRESRIQFGQGAPWPAIHVVAGKGNDSSSTWLGMGDRVTLQYQGREVTLTYYPEQVPLPFSLTLNRFTIDRYEGTNDPASYQSAVTVQDAGEKSDVVISMNEPLVHGGITFYQSSYEDAEPRPTVSIFSVNRDPGRIAKYLGSFLLVLGSILLFAAKYRKKGKQQASGKAVAS